jgi:hypothetical protein
MKVSFNFGNLQKPLIVLGVDLENRRDEWRKMRFSLKTSKQTYDIETRRIVQSIMVDIRS